MQDEPTARTPQAIETLQWSDEQATRRVTQKMEALINEYLNRVARFLGIHSRSDTPKPRPAFERSERRLDLMMKTAEICGLEEWARVTKALHLNLSENYDKYALPIRHSLDTPKPGEAAMESVPLTQTEADILDRLSSRREDLGG
jgi:hypothetical protein